MKTSSQTNSSGIDKSSTGELKGVSGNSTLTPERLLSSQDDSIFLDIDMTLINSTPTSRKPLKRSASPKTPDLFEDSESFVNKSPIFKTSQKRPRRLYTSPRVLQPLPSNQDIQALTRLSYSENSMSYSSNLIGGLNSGLRNILARNALVGSPMLGHPNLEASQLKLPTQLNFSMSASVKGAVDDSFFGLPDSIRKLLELHRGIPSLYKWQEECLNLALSKPTENLLYSLPTSGGKTLVAEILMLREILCFQRDCLFVIPYVSLVEEKVRALSPLAVELGFIVEEYAGSRGALPPRKRRKRNCIYVATMEKAHGLVNSLLELHRLPEIGLMAIDEVHMVGEGGRRGSGLETLITKTKLASNGPRIVAMSATVGNLEELARFLQATVYLGHFRPVPLREYLKVGDHLWEIDNNRRGENAMKNGRALAFKYTPEQRKSDPDFIGGLVMEVVPEFSCLVFCSTKRNCESVALLICKIMQSSYALREHNHVSKRALLLAFKQAGEQLCPVLEQTVPFGVAYHHSADERRLLEEAFLAGTLCCICCTSTLAAGVNLPARRVIIRAPYIASDMLSRTRYQQMIGRAGRAGLDTIGESITIVFSALNGPVEKVRSSLMDDGQRGLQVLLLSTITLNIGGQTPRLLWENLLLMTLWGQQATAEGVDIRTLVKESLNDLLKAGLLIQLNVSEFDWEAELKVSKLGQAALKGCIELDKAGPLYCDLEKAQMGLMLRTRLHLLYLVTPYELVGTIVPQPSVYLKMFARLQEEEMNVGRSLGINEAMLIRMMSGTNLKEKEFVISRFYLTLILNDVWQGKDVWEVASTYGTTRGAVQNLLSSAVAFANCVLRFCEVFDEFWAFASLLDTFSKQMALCAQSELIPLLELPAVKKGRAMQLFKAGYRTLRSVANANPQDMVKRIELLPSRVAKQIVAAAKAEALQEEAEFLAMGVIFRNEFSPENM